MNVADRHGPQHHSDMCIVQWKFIHSLCSLSACWR